MAESFFASLKNELVNRTAFPTVGYVKKAVLSTSKSSTIGSGFTQGSAIEPHTKSTPDTNPPARSVNQLWGAVRKTAGRPRHVHSTRAITHTQIVACQLDGTTVLPRPRDHLGLVMMLMRSPWLVN